MNRGLSKPGPTLHPGRCHPGEAWRSRRHRGRWRKFPPPRSAEFNPIEKGLAKVKVLLRKPATRTVITSSRAIAGILDVVATNEMRQILHHGRIRTGLIEKVLQPDRRASLSAVTAVIVRKHRMARGSSAICRRVCGGGFRSGRRWPGRWGWRRRAAHWRRCSAGWRGARLPCARWGAG